MWLHLSLHSLTEVVFEWEDRRLPEARRMEALAALWFSEKLVWWYSIPQGKGCV